MMGRTSIDDLTNHCVEKYIQDHDYRYSIGKPPLDQAFFNEVYEIIRDTYPYIIGFALERIYQTVKKKLSEKKEKEAMRLISQQKVLNVFGNGAVLLFGEVRPFFEIPMNSKLYFYNVNFQNGMPTNATPFRLQTNLVVPEGVSLVLRDATIVYEGKLGQFIREYKAPSLFFIKSSGIAA
ncbi:hypothetical protein Thermo_01675 [Thermoplasmatales archaeon]|nr:hypothetical protein Thermo_01675 [Thermoplasmatales archaeon]